MQYVYREDGSIATKYGQPVSRRGTPPPCHDCPKVTGEEEQTPWNGEENTLSRKNHAMLDAYFRAKGSGRPAADAVQAECFGSITRTMEMFDRRTQATIAKELIRLNGRLERR